MAAWSERELIKRISSACASAQAGVVKGIGDDCCEIALPSASLLLSTDTLVDDVHFNRDWHPPYLLGRKSVAVNLSDIAAMGGRPLFVLFSLCLPPELDQLWIDRWLDGAFAILHEFNTELIGGDTVRGSEIVITVTVLGRASPGGSIYRSGAEVGDSVWVSGCLGSAGAGLELLAADKGETTQWDQELQPLIDAHLNPVPRVQCGIELAQSGLLTAMQDISDGVATDLAHICQASGLAAVLIKDRLPALSGLASACRILDRDAEDFMLRSGEDYELLFTVKRGREKEFMAVMKEKKLHVYQIGEMRTGAGVFLETDRGREDISYQGYEHSL